MKILLSFLFLLFSVQGISQTVKMKIANVTAAAGEDVLAFQTAVTNSGSTGSGSGTGVTSFDAIEFRKVNNTSTNNLFQRSINQTTLQEVSFEFYDAASTMYYKVVLKDVNITKFSYLLPECNGCAKLYHDVKMQYAKIEVTDVATGNTIKFNLATRSFYS